MNRLIADPLNKERYSIQWFVVINDGARCVISDPSLPERLSRDTVAFIVWTRGKDTFGFILFFWGWRCRIYVCIYIGFIRCWNAAKLGCVHTFFFRTIRQCSASVIIYYRRKTGKRHRLYGRLLLQGFLLLDVLSRVHKQMHIKTSRVFFFETKRKTFCYYWDFVTDLILLITSLCIIYIYENQDVRRIRAKPCYLNHSILKPFTR